MKRPVKAEILHFGSPIAMIFDADRKTVVVTIYPASDLAKAQYIADAINAYDKEYEEIHK